MGKRVSVANLAFPDDGRSPTHALQLSNSRRITTDVTFELAMPELDVGFRLVAVSTAGMAVPIAAMDEKRRPQSGKD